MSVMRQQGRNEGNEPALRAKGSVQSMRCGLSSPPAAPLLALCVPAAAELPSRPSLELCRFHRALREARALP